MKKGENAEIHQKQTLLNVGEKERKKKYLNPEKFPHVGIPQVFVKIPSLPTGIAVKSPTIKGTSLTRLMMKMKNETRPSSE